MLLESMIPAIQEQARTNLRDYGDVLPVILLNLDGKGEVISLAKFLNEGIWDRTRNHLIALIQAGRLHEFIVLCEAFQTRMAPAEFQRFLQTGTGERPVDVVMLAYASPRREYSMTAEIGRDQRSLESWSPPMESGGIATGRPFGSALADLWAVAAGGRN